MTGTAETGGVLTDPLEGIVGQPAVVARLRAAAQQPVHAYLFVGPRGSGKRAAALAFAAELLSQGADGIDAERHRRLALAGHHPDVVLIAPEGRTLRVGEAELIIVEASRSPIECGRKVIVVERFHTAEPEAAASLLKTIEEPAATAIFVLLAENVPPEHITISSRCTTIDFAPIAPEVMARALENRGVTADRARRLAAMAGGNLDRALLLAEDENALRRLDAWLSVPERLDGTGAAAAVLVEEVRGLIDDAGRPLEDRHKRELAELAELEASGMRSGVRKAVVERQRREVRLLRDDELRTGLACLARRYRDELVASSTSEPWADAVGAITAATDGLIRNPNEALLLQGLFVTLPVISGGGRSDRVPLS